MSAFKTMQSSPPSVNSSITTRGATTRTSKPTTDMPATSLLSTPSTPATPITSSISTKSTTDSSSLIQPIELLRTPLARAYTNIHPLLILALFYATFPQTVRDPVASMTRLILPVALAQSAYCAICLPVAVGGSKEEGSSGKSKAGGGGVLKRKSGVGSSGGGSGVGPSWGSRVVTALLSTTLTLTLSTPSLTALLILHGAPLTTHHLHTFLLALHLSLLATLPLFYTHGVSGPHWRDLVSLSSPVDEVLGGAMGSLVGAWMGAVPIPLDWDREWQRWPVTVLVGGVVGWAVGRGIGGWMRGRRIVWGV